MAQKHKSKYKAPKDLEKSQKPKPRKDLKDYTHDDKPGALNPKSTGDKQLNVLRKTDKEMVDDGKMYVKYNEDDRLYKDIEEGEWDPKTAAKRLKKRQDAEEKETADVLQDKIENLTREQKERLVREYVRRKIVKVLLEQPTPPEEETPTEEPAAEPAAEPVEEPVAEPAAAPAADTMPTDMATPAPAAPAPTATPDMAATDATAPTPDATTPAPDATTAALTPEELENRVITNMANELQKEGGIGKIKALSKTLKIAMKETDPADQANFYRLLRQFAIKKLSTLNPEK